MIRSLANITVWNVSKYGVFLVRILPHLDWIQKDTKYLSVFSPNAGKYGPEKIPSLDTFHAVHLWWTMFWDVNYIDKNNLSQVSDEVLNTHLFFKENFDNGLVQGVLK